MLEALEGRIRDSEAGLERRRPWQICEGPFSALCPALAMETGVASKPTPATSRSPHNELSPGLWPSNDDWHSSLSDNAFLSEVLTPNFLGFDTGDGFQSIDKSSSLEYEHVFAPDSYDDLSSEDKSLYVDNAVDKYLAPDPTSALSSFYGHPLSTSLPNGSPYLPYNVRFLLSHYTSHVIDSLSLLPTNKAPYRGIHLPCALTAYGELDIMGQSDFARVSLLYSLLSLTCYHLSSLYESSSGDQQNEHQSSGAHPEASNARYWSSQALKFRDIARTAFRKCLQAMVSDPTIKVKYKELFVGAMSLICTGVSCPFRSQNINH